jgi:hypothetical protein
METAMANIKDIVVLNGPDVDIISEPEGDFIYLPGDTYKLIAKARHGFKPVGFRSNRDTPFLGLAEKLRPPRSGRWSPSTSTSKSRRKPSSLRGAPGAARGGRRFDAAARRSAAARRRSACIGFSLRARGCYSAWFARIRPGGRRPAVLAGLYGQREACCRTYRLGHSYFLTYAGRLEKLLPRGF